MIHAPGSYFVSSRTWQGHRIFLNDQVARIFVEALLEYRGQNRYFLHGFVVMPEHFHVILTPAGDLTLERAVQFIKGGSARKIGEQRGLRFPVWQKGFTDHRIRDYDDYVAHLSYIEQNPVKRGLASSPEEYKWSSAARKFTLDGVPQRLKPLGMAAAVRHG